MLSVLLLHLYVYLFLSRLYSKKKIRVIIKYKLKEKITKYLFVP